MPYVKNEKKIKEKQKDKQINDLNDMIGIMLLDSADDKVKIEDLQGLTGDLLMEVAILKGGV